MDMGLYLAAGQHFRLDGRLVFTRSGKGKAYCWFGEAALAKKCGLFFQLRIILRRIGIDMDEPKVFSGFAWSVLIGDWLVWGHDSATHMTMVKINSIPMIAKVENHTSLPFKGYSRINCILVALFALLLSDLAATAEPQVPNYIDPRERISAPDISDRTRIRFLTTVDFPPFNFLDQSQKLAGFNVDLARAICEILGVVDKCQIQALPWSELDAALLNGQGEALIAGVAKTAGSKAKYLFSRPYLELPARFVVPKRTADNSDVAANLNGKRVGVISGSAHEAMLRSWFPDIRAVPFSQLNWAHQSLRDGKIEGIFGDGVQLSFWLQSPASQDCCRFLGGPYLSPVFLGEGLTIAVSPANRELVAAFDNALSQLNRNGRFAELYLRWFPGGLY